VTSEKVKTLGHAILVLLGAIGVVAALSLAGCTDKEWESFKAAHHCKVVGHTNGGTGISSRGSIVFLPDYTSWLCDDGITYTREE
jgi:hypothetical protein